MNTRFNPGLAQEIKQNKFGPIGSFRPSAKRQLIPTSTETQHQPSHFANQAKPSFYNDPNPTGFQRTNQTSPVTPFGRNKFQGTIDAHNITYHSPNYPKSFGTKAQSVTRSMGMKQLQQTPGRNDVILQGFELEPDVGRVKRSPNLGLMTLPKPNVSTQHFQSHTSTTQASSNMGDHTQTRSHMKTGRYGESQPEKTFMFTGTVERVLKWGKIFQNHFCYFEVVAAVVSVTDGKFPFEKTMLLRDKKGPILQVIYYSNATHINIEDFHLGQILRVVGRITGANIMCAISVRAASVQEIEALPRMCCISDHAISTFCGQNVGN